MTEPIVEVTGYASVADFELRTSIDVPPEQEPALQIRLNDNSTLIGLYLGDCAEAVEAEYADLLTSLTCDRTFNQIQHPVGIASASVGSTSVSYQSGSGETSWLSPSDTEILDRLILSVCGPETDVPGLGELGVGWGGPPEDEPSDHLWVLTGPARRLT